MPKAKKTQKTKKLTKITGNLKRENDKTVIIMLFGALALVLFAVCAFFYPSAQLSKALKNTIGLTNYSVRLDDGEKLIYRVAEPRVESITKFDDGVEYTYEDYDTRDYIVIDGSGDIFRRDLQEAENDFSGIFGVDGILTGGSWTENSILESALAHMHDFKYKNGAYTVKTLPMEISDYTRNAINEGRVKDGIPEITDDELVLYNVAITIAGGYVKTVSYDDAWLSMDGEIVSSKYELYDIKNTQIVMPE